MGALSIALSWDELEDWAGDTIVERGKHYRDNVLDPRLTEDGALLAWVDGSETYTTLVWRIGDGELDCQCSCPYSWGPCKHAVALLLEANGMAVEGRGIAVAAADDVRLEAWSDDDEVVGLSIPGAVPGAVSATGSIVGDGIDEELLLRLQRQSPEQLHALVLRLAQTGDAAAGVLRKQLFPEVASDDCGAVAAEARKLIEQTAADHGWQNYWERSGHTPDWGPVQSRLEDLLRGGCLEALVGLADGLLDSGAFQISNSDDEGEISAAIAACFEPVLQAVSTLPWSSAECWLWFSQLQDRDDYALLDGVGSPVAEEDLDADDWRLIAVAFSAELAALPKPAGDDNSGSYRRKMLLRRATHAWRQAGDFARVIALLRAELDYCNCYQELVTELLDQGQREQAAALAVEGFKHNRESARGISAAMLELLCTMAVDDDDYARLAALEVERFVQDYTLDGYRRVRAAASAADVWQAVRPPLLGMLEDGKDPRYAAAWPLPASGLDCPLARRFQNWPQSVLVIEIALDEGRLDDAVAAYEHTPSNAGLGDKLADAVQASHPEFSLGHWRRRAERLIAEVKPKAYRQAKPLLRKLQHLHAQLGQEQLFDEYLLRLRREHKAKRRLQEVVDEIAAGPRAVR